MTETPKRRGRPPGSRNIPKIRPDDHDPVAPLSIPIPGPGAVRYAMPAKIESWTTGPYGVNVSIRFKVAMSSEGEFVEVTWPTGWPIPQLNDVIRAGGKAGRVQWVEYDHDAGVIRISAT